MKNADKPIHPYVMQQVGLEEYRPHKEGDPKEYTIRTQGLSKREYFSALAMQGILTGRFTALPIDVASWSIAYADELLKQLEK